MKLEPEPLEITCDRCGLPASPGRYQCIGCGSFLVGNQAAVTHGMYARQVVEEPQAVAVLQEQRSAIVSDLGADVSRIKGDLVQRYVEASLIADHLFNNVQQHGVLTGKGRTRAAVATYLQVLDRVVRLGQLLGLERRQKRVSDPFEYAAQTYGAKADT